MISFLMIWGLLMGFYFTGIYIEKRSNRKKVEERDRRIKELEVLVINYYRGWLYNHQEWQDWGHTAFKNLSKWAKEYEVSREDLIIYIDEMAMNIEQDKAVGDAKNILNANHNI